MSILKYCFPVITSCLDDEVGCSVPTATIKEVNKVLEVQKNGKKRGCLTDGN